MGTGDVVVRQNASAREAVTRAPIPTAKTTRGRTIVILRYEPCRQQPGSRTGTSAPSTNRAARTRARARWGSEEGSACHRDSVIGARSDGVVLTAPGYLGAGAAGGGTVRR